MGRPSTKGFSAVGLKSFILETDHEHQCDLESHTASFGGPLQVSGVVSGILGGSLEVVADGEEMCR